MLQEGRGGDDVERPGARRRCLEEAAAAAAAGEAAVVVVVGGGDAGGHGEEFGVFRGGFCILPVERVEFVAAAAGQSSESWSRLWFYPHLSLFFFYFFVIFMS